MKEGRKDISTVSLINVGQTYKRKVLFTSVGNDSLRLYYKMHINVILIYFHITVMDVQQ